MYAYRHRRQEHAEGAVSGISVRGILFLTWALLLPMQALAQVQTPRFPIRRFAI